MEVVSTEVVRSVGGDAFSRVVGQAPALRALRAAARTPVHAYLLVGPAGAGARAAAEGFSAALLCADGGCGHCRDCRLALAGQHPDALLFAPSGASLLKEQVSEIIRMAVRSPTEGDRKVLVLSDFHRIDAAVGPKLLKTVEEPPASTVFVIVADHLPPELATIASRCVRIDLPPLTPSEVADALVAEGADVAAAEVVAAAALGDVERARLLLTDEGLGARREAWASVPRRLDGTGATVVAVVAELLDQVEQAAAPLRAAQDLEVAALEERIAAYGERGSGRGQLESEHKRQLRRHRTGELRFGLATLAARYRDALAGDAVGVDGAACVRAVTAIDAAADALVRNPNEPLLLQALLLGLPPLPGGRADA
jgi:DNA polymerase-3 subunit delta'